MDSLLATLRPFFVHHFARRVPADDAEDLAQMALLGIAQAHARIDPERVLAYVLTVADNRLRSARRRAVRESKRMAPVELAENMATSDSPDIDAERAEVARAVREACAQTLPPSLCDIAVSLLRGLSQADIAVLQSVPAGTVRWRWKQARTLLRHRLSPYR